MQGSDGNLYGTAAAGGAYGDGTAFQLTPGGVFTKLHDFLAASDGQTPDSSLVEGSDGSFYGQARFGGTSQGQPEFGAPSPGFGTVYRVSPDGEFTVLHRYAGEDGAFPVAGMILGSDGNFYGTTSDGGTVPVAGVAFRLSPAGVQTVLHTFSADYLVESISRLVAATDGNFYGTIARGGDYGYGSVFRLTREGEFTTLYSFGDGRPNDGTYPETGLIQGRDGNFYGTTVRGGGWPDYGLIYRITPSGEITFLHGFTDEEGITPSELIQDADGNLYGTTQGGGKDGRGTVFKLEAGGDLLTIHRFSGEGDGQNPIAGLVRGSDGSLYGSTMNGAAANGTIFRLQLSAVPPGTVSLAAAGDGRVQYRMGKGVVVFRRTGDLGLPLTVTYTFKGSAVPGEDFKPLGGTLTIPVGARQAKVKITPLSNAANPGKRKLKITLSPTSDGSYKTAGPTTVTLNVLGGG